jgi:hypothetical protein
MHLWLGNLKEKGGSRFATLLLFPCVTGETGRKYVRYVLPQRSSSPLDQEDIPLVKGISPCPRWPLGWEGILPGKILNWWVGDVPLTK